MSPPPLTHPIENSPIYNNLSDISENNFNDTSEYDVVVQHEDDPFTILKDFRIKNINRLIIGHLNIKRIEGKFAALKEIIQCNIDILVISETKLNESYFERLFDIEGYTLPFR